MSQMQDMGSAQNVDYAEIDKFSRLADKWWDLAGDFKALHDINPLRLGYVERKAGLVGKRVLDVGCGGGILSESMAVAGAGMVLGIDMAQKSLSAAACHAAQVGVGNLRYRCVRVEDLAEEVPHSFDVVTCMEMMEHVPDPQSIISACARLVKPDGMVFFSTINRNVKSYVHAIIGAEYVLGLVPKGTHDWKKFITPAQLARMCRLAGLNVLNTKGMAYRVWEKRYYLSDNVDVNYLMACRLG